MTMPRLGPLAGVALICISGFASDQALAQTKMEPEPAPDPVLKKDQLSDAEPGGEPAPVIKPAPGLIPDKALTLAPKEHAPKEQVIAAPDEGASGEELPEEPIQSAMAKTPKPEPETDPETDPATCPADVLWLRGDFGKARFTVDVADTRESRAQGLMNVPSMPASKGMLFVYPFAQEVAFWMKNTLIPLDIIYANDQGVVTSVQTDAIPGDLTPLPGEGLVQYVLEINAGLAKDLGITAGAQIQHPAILTPAWPCE